MRNGLRLLTAAAVLLLLPAAAAHGFEYGDPVPILRGDLFDVREASSGPGHGTALHVWDTDLDAGARSLVAFQDAAGRWHRFTAAGEPERVRLAQLDGGAGLAAWRDDSGAVNVRTWSRDGTLAAARPVLPNARRWALSADRAGTVAIAATDKAGAISATVRDPGGDFTPPQQLGKGTQFELSPIAPDGSVSVRFGREQATRTGRASTFAAATPEAQPADPALWAVDDSRSARVGPAVLRLCHDRCTTPQRFAWGTRELLTFHAPAAHRFERARWYVAPRQPDGRFDQPELATLDFPRRPVWTPTGLAFTHASRGDIAGRLRGLYLVPFDGPSRLTPRLYLSEVRGGIGTVRFTVFCRTACRVSGTINGGAFSDYDGALLSPLEPATLRIVARASVRKLRIALIARDVHGATTRLVRTVPRPYTEIIPLPPDGDATAPGSAEH